MSVNNYKKALIDFCTIDHWDNCCAFTFNMKQAIKLKEVYCKNKRIDWFRLDRIRCYQCFKEFMRDLNRRIYKFADIKYGKRLNVIAFLEKSNEGRFHFHAAIEAPKHLTQEQFCKLAMDVWLEQDFGYGHGRTKVNADNGWIDYMTKSKSKDGFDHYLDCLDIDTFRNKIVIA